MTNTNTPTPDTNPAVAGNAFYYSLQGLEISQRQALIGLQAFANQIHKITEQYQEPSVVKVKLTWWQEELERLNTQPRHPITQWLQHYVQQYALDIQHLQAMVEGSYASLTPQRFTTEAELYRHYQYTGGILESLKAQVLCHDSLDEPTTQAVHYLGIANEIVRHIADAAQHFNRQQYYFTATDKLQTIAQNTAQRNTLWRQQATQAQQCYQDAIALLSQDTAKRLRPLRLYTHLQLLTLGKMQRQHFPVLQRHVELTPLKLWWVSCWFL